MTTEGAKGKSKGFGPALPLKGNAKGDTKSKPRIEDIEAIHTACQFDDEIAVKQLFSKQSQSCPDAYMRRGATPLHTAALNGSCRAVRLLLAERANVDAINHWKETSLHMSSAGNQTSVITILIDAKAAIEAKDSWGRTAYRVAQENGSHQAMARLLEEGAQDVLAEDVRMVPTEQQDAQHRALAQEIVTLVQARPYSPPIVDPNVKHMFNPLSTSTSNTGRDAAIKGRQPLSKLVEYPGDPFAVAQLLSQVDTVDPAGRDAFGLTALHKFAAWNKVDLIELLLPQLDDEDINATGGDEGFSALHHAVSMGAINTLDVLLQDQRVIKNTCDKSGHTAETLASKMPECKALADRFGS